MMRRALIVTLLLAASPATAHDYWLAPVSHAVPADAEVKVSLLVGEHLVAEQNRPFEGDRMPRIEVVNARGVRDIASMQTDNAVPFLRVPLTGEGGQLLLVDRVAAEIELPAARFERYLGNEGLARIVEQRARLGETERSGRERYRRNLKALLQVGTKQDQTYGKVIGQTIELVPDHNPTFAKPGDKLTFRLTFRGKPLANLRVEAWSRGVPGANGVSVVRSARYETDADGKVQIAIDRRGEWLVRAVHMIRCEQDCDTTEWESYWTAYTFGNPTLSAGPAAPVRRAAAGGVPMIAVVGAAAGIAAGVGGAILLRRRRAPAP